MDTNKFAGMTAGIVVMLLLASAVLVPTIDGARMTTTTVSNEGAGWAKFAYYEDSEDYSVALSSDGTTLTMGAQSGTADDMIVWASDSAAVIHDGGSFTLLYKNGDSSAAADLGSSATIASVSGALTITDSSSTDVYTSDAVEWTYTPNAGGAFGFFTESGATVKDFPVATAGSFAGVTAYNAMNSINYATMAPTYSVTDGVFTTGPWTVPDLGAKTVKTSPTEVKEIEEKQIEDMQTIKSVPTPQYTDGDWGFNLIGEWAAIVSYSGSAGNLEIPSTVSDGTNTYTVKYLGKGAANTPIFDNSSITGSTITIPSTVTTIQAYSFYNCSGFTGELVIPSSVTFIGNYAFHGCSGFTGELVIPSSVTEIRQYSFYNCSGFTGELVIPSSVSAIAGLAFRGLDIDGTLTIPSSVTSIIEQAFAYCEFTSLILYATPTSFYYNVFENTPIAEVLNLGDYELTAGSKGLSADVVISDEIASLGYIAPVSFSETVANEGAIYDMLAVIPILVIASIMISVAGMIILRRE